MVRNKIKMFAQKKVTLPPGKHKIIILDEPTTALLPDEAATLFAQMRRLASEGHGFLYVSHRLSEVFDIADRATVLRDRKRV